MAKARPINDFLQKVAIKELNEVPERIPADIDALRTWIQQQPHLNARTDDQFLLSFLRGCKFSLEKAKSKIDKYYALRTKYPEYFTSYDVDDAKFREIFHLGLYIVLPTPLHDNGPRIILMRGGFYPAEKYDFPDIGRSMAAIQDIIIREDDYANINGIVIVMDSERASLAHFLQMTPKIMKTYTMFSEEAVPLRPKANHMINTLAVLEPLFNLFKPMMSKKQQERLFVYGTNWEALYKSIPKKYLPLEYGGENGSIPDIIADWERKLDEYSEYFKEDRNYGTNEVLRVGKPIDFDSLFGTEGSFRKLEVD